MQTGGDHIGRHETICLLGEGGMAKVYLGLFRGAANVKKLVVMKQIRSELARDKRLVTLFLDEARLSTRLNHPNVVHTYDVLEEGGKYVLTMEYLQGQSLAEILDRIDLRFFPLHEHLWILTQVLAGLQYAHALADYDGSPLGVVHRDVSPGNTFVTYHGDVKLLDFGIAKASGAVSVTQKGTFKGKISYCAPEQIQGSTVDARADLFAVGVMLWEALARRRIDVSGGYPVLVQTRLSGKEPRIREVNPDVAPVLADICDRAMALSPGDRYLTAADFQRDLERYLENSAPRVGRGQISELMRFHFDAERRAMQKRIEAHLHLRRRASPAEVHAWSLDDDECVVLVDGAQKAVGKASGWTIPQAAAAFRPWAAVEPVADAQLPPPSFPRTRSWPFPEPAPPEVAAPVDTSPSPPPAKATTARWFVLLAIGAVAVSSLTLLNKGAKPGFVRGADRAPVTTAATVKEAPVPPRAILPVAVVSPPAETIQVDITVSPPRAKLTLDGEEVSPGGLHSARHKDRGIHILRASAPGFVPFSQSVSFASDVRLDIRLATETHRHPSSSRGAPTPRRRGNIAPTKVSSFTPPPEQTRRSGEETAAPETEWRTSPQPVVGRAD